MEVRQVMTQAWGPPLTMSWTQWARSKTSVGAELDHRLGLEPRFQSPFPSCSISTSQEAARENTMAARPLPERSCEGQSQTAPRSLSWPLDCPGKTTADSALGFRTEAAQGLHRPETVIIAGAPPVPMGLL